ncbi:MAG: hypothetical protein ISS72_05570 [Candidatus Brocadiae bacterium]|nr:hypothetical protein [Candidatus Brocadiia bacterium]
MASDGQHDPAEETSEKQRKPRGCRVPRPGEKPPRFCVPCTLYSVVLFLLVLVLLWLALRGH